MRAAVAAHGLLREEVRVAQRITHPNVCRTFDLETIGTLYVAKMELVRGETIAFRLARDGAMPVAEALRIARAIAGGLAAAHEQRVVHRDLKPGNVMLTGEGRVVLMDFALAQPIASGDGDVAGTPGYMSPNSVKDASSTSEPTTTRSDA